jgi:hypothetical protein
MRQPVWGLAPTQTGRRDAPAGLWDRRPSPQAGRLLRAAARGAAESSDQAL